MPMNSDNENRAGDTRWQPRGVGMQPTFRCAGCDKASQPLGSRRLGPFRLPYCAPCVVVREAKKAAKAAAQEAACL